MASNLPAAMKNVLRAVGSTIAALGIALVVVSCEGRDEPADTGAGASSGDGTGSGKVSGNQNSPPGNLEEQVVGYWAPNADAMKQRLEDELKGNPGELAAAKAMIDPRLSAMALQIPAKGQVVIHEIMGAPQPSTYTVKSIDLPGRTLEIAVTDKGKVQDGTITIDGNQLTLSKGEDTLILDRIDEAAFRKRQQPSTTAPAIPGISSTPDSGATEPPEPAPGT